MPRRQLAASAERVRRRVARRASSHAGTGGIARQRRHPVLELQNKLGNQRVERLIEAKRVTPDGLRSASFEQQAKAADPSRARGAGEPLEAAVSASMGGHFTTDFSAVRVHTGSGVDDALAMSGARAMAQGSDLYFRSGEYDPHSTRGRELIGHELAHVVQQSDGRTAGLNAKQATGAPSGALEGEANKEGAAAAAAAAAPFDWSQVDTAAYEAEIRRREQTGEPVPLAKTAAEARATPLAREIAGRCIKGAKPVSATPGGPVQHKKDWNEYPLGGIYNSVEISGLEGKWFVEQGPGSVGSYDLGQHMGAVTSGANSRRDGNFGVEMPPQTWNYDNYKSALWDLTLQSKTGGKGSRTLSMHNWAFSNIEVSESFEVVDAGTVAPGGFSGNVHAVDQKIPIVLTGSHSKAKVSYAENFKQTSGWTVGREIVDSATMTRAMSLGFGASLEDEAKNKAAAEIGFSSKNVSTIKNKIATLGGAATTLAEGIKGETELAGKAGETIRKYVYPVYSVKNFKVTAYPHDPVTAEVTDKKPHTFAVSSLALVRVESIDANNDEGRADVKNSPSPGQNAEDELRKAEKAGKEIEGAGGTRVKIALEREVDAQKDFDNQDFTQTLSEGEQSRSVTRSWTKGTENSFSLTNQTGQVVTGEDGWTLGAKGKYSGVGAGLSYGEIKARTGEFGDQVVNAGTAGKTQTVEVTQTVTGPAGGSGKVVQVILLPLFRERVYTYAGFDDKTATWSALPIKARSKYYYPVGAVTTREVPARSELKPEGHGKLDETLTRGAATGAKALKMQMDAEKDPAKKAALARALEDLLLKNREAMEETARRAHPSLKVIDRDRNIYEITLQVPVADADKAKSGLSTVEKKYQSTIEALLDFSAPSVAAHNAADAFRTEDPGAAGVTIKSTAGLGGTGAQGGANPYPGDVDLAESVTIVAPSADAAAEAFAAAIQASVRHATAPRDDGKVGYTFYGCMIGVLPADAKKPGAPVRFTAAQTMSGSMNYDRDARHGGGKGTLTLAQAIAAPAAGRSANTYWRGPIDVEGTYGEITKVLNYDAVKTGPGAEHLFGTPMVGQSFQEVGFGDKGRHDTERARLLEPLSRDIAKYAAEGNWVKALKRAYTVARMLNDVATLNRFEPLLGGDVSQLKQIVDHLEMFAEDVVNPRIDDKLKGGIGTPVTDEQAVAEAVALQARMTGIDAARDYAPIMQRAIDAAAGKMTHNGKPYFIIDKEIVEPLNAKIRDNAEFGRKAKTALIDSGYFKHS